MEFKNEIGLDENGNYITEFGMWVGTVDKPPWE